MQIKRKKFLVAPLDWGLGHATRCIPVIRALLDRGQDVVIAAQGRPASLLRGEFPGLPIVPILNYNISYAANPVLLALKFPGMLLRVAHCAFHEHRQVRRIVGRERIDCIISDSRFGCFDRRVWSVYLSHQLCLKMPPGFSFLEKPAWQGLHAAAQRYDETWIPDLPGEEGLTGDLTQRYPLPRSHRYVGLLSRFVPAAPGAVEDLDLLVSLSGPEPQRTIFENAVIRQLGAFAGSAVVLRGKAGEREESALSGSVRLLSHASGDEILQLLNRARAVVCRGGYTSIMELMALGKKAVLVPTPGQTEQEYLCARLAARGWFAKQDQDRFDIASGLSQLAALAPAAPRPGPHSELLRNAVDQLVISMA